MFGAAYGGFAGVADANYAVPYGLPAQPPLVDAGAADADDLPDVYYERPPPPPYGGPPPFEDPPPTDPNAPDNPPK